LNREINCTTVYYSGILGLRNNSTTVYHWN